MPFLNSRQKEQHRHNTRENYLNVPPVKTTTYGFNSVTLCAIGDRNNLQNKPNPESALPDLSVHVPVNVTNIAAGRK